MSSIWEMRTSSKWPARFDEQKVALDLISSEFGSSRVHRFRYNRSTISAFSRYVLKLAEHVRQLFPEDQDEHLFELEVHIRRLVVTYVWQRNFFFLDVVCNFGIIQRINAKVWRHIAVPRVLFALHYPGYGLICLSLNSLCCLLLLVSIERQIVR